MIRGRAISFPPPKKKEKKKKKKSGVKGGTVRSLLCPLFSSSLCSSSTETSRRHKVPSLSLGSVCVYGWDMFEKEYLYHCGVAQILFCPNSLQIQADWFFGHFLSLIMSKLICLALQHYPVYYFCNRLNIALWVEALATWHTRWKAS